MAREHRSARLQTRDARRKLAPRREPYWYEIERGRAIGYYKGSNVGSWYIREFLDGTYRWRTLGRADDRNDADGDRILSFSDVVRLALRGRHQEHEEDPARRAVRSDLTVEAALEDYLEARKVRCSSADLVKDRIAIEALIVPTIGGRNRGELTDEERHRLRHSLYGKLVGQLTTADLRRWRDSRVPQTDDRELRRRSQATANKVWSLLRAALNLAYQNERTPSDQAWRRIRPFKNVDRPQTRFLQAGDCRRLIEATEPDFSRLIRACLLTGMRLGELVALTVADIGPDHLTVHHSKTGSSRRVPLNPEGAELFQAVIAGRDPKDFVLLQTSGDPWTPMRVSRALRRACKAAKIDPPIQFRQLRTTYGSLLLNADAPLSTISELLGHKDTRMTRRHYAHLMWDKLKETVDERLPSFSAAPKPSSEGSSETV
jgi:integrase